MPNSIGGLASGLDTAGIIDSLLANERVGRTRLETREAKFAKQLNVWQDFDSKLNALKTATDAFTSPSKAAAATATSSLDTSLGVSAGAGSAPGTYSLRVKQLAASHQVRATGFTSTTQLAGAGKGVVASSLGSVGIGSITAIAGAASGRYEIDVRSVTATTATVTLNGHSQTVDLTGPISLEDANGNRISFSAGGLKVGKALVGIVDSDNTTTLAGLATKINALDAGVSAMAVDLNDGTGAPVNFIMSAQQAGSANAITSDLYGLSAFTAPFTDLRAASDAKILLADGTTEVTRATNKVSDLIPGVTLDLKAADPAKDITVTVAKDNDKVVAAAKSLVDSMNSLVGAVKRSTSYDAATKTAATLTGDSRARRIEDALRNAMRYSDDDQSLTMLSQVGISLNASGTYTFDETKLRKALTDDYSGTLRLLAGDGASRKGAFGTVRDAVTTLQSDGGVVDAAMSTAQASIASLKEDMAAFDTRLALTENRIRRKYTQLETTLAQLSSQQNELTRSLG